MPPLIRDSGVEEALSQYPWDVESVAELKIGHDRVYEVFAEGGGHFVLRIQRQTNGPALEWLEALAKAACQYLGHRSFRRDRETTRSNKRGRGLELLSFREVPGAATRRFRGP